MNALLFLLLAATSPQSDAAFAEAKEKYDAMDVEGAQQAFSELAEAEADPVAKAKVLVWLGLTQAELGAFEESDATFRAAFDNDLESALPADSSPKIAERFAALQDDARAQAALAPPPDEAVEPDEPLDDDDDDSVLSVENILLGTGGVALAATIVFGAIAGSAWVVAVVLFQSALGTPDAEGAQRTYFNAQVLAWAGNALMGTALVTLLLGSAATAGWAVMATLE